MDGIASFDGDHQTGRYVNLRGVSTRPGSNNRNAFLRQRQAEREKRENDRKRKSASIYIQATWRSYKSRILFYKKLRSDALILLNQLISEKKRNQMDYEKLNQISSVIIFTSKESWEDDLVSGYVHLVSTDSNFKFTSKSNISTSYLMLEILRYLQCLSRESSPRLSPGLRVIEKLLSTSSSVASISAQLGIFNILADLVELSLPANSDSFEVLPPRSMQILDITLKILNRLQNSKFAKIGFRCFLRDFIGMSNCSIVHAQIAQQLKKDAESCEIFFRVLSDLRIEKVKIVSINSQPARFGDFINSRISRLNNFNAISVFPDLNLLQFALILQNDEIGSLLSICWISQFCSFENIVPSESRMETDQSDDEDWLDDDDEEDFINRPIVQALSENQKRVRDQLFNYLLRQNYLELSPELAIDVARLFYLFNEQSALSRLSINVEFQTQLWNACSVFGSGPFGMSPIMDRIRSGLPVEYSEFDTFRTSMAFFCNLARTSLIPLSDSDIVENKFVIPRCGLSVFVSELCRLCVGIIRHSYPSSGKTSISSSLWFALLIPITKLLRSLLDRSTRINNLVDQNAWLVDFPISDISVLQRREMLNDNNEKFQNVQQNFYGAKSYEKQLMSLLSFVPFCIPFDKRVDIFYSIVNEEFKQFQNQTDGRGMYRYHRFNVRRDHLYEDAYSEMSEQNYPDWRQRFAVQFRNQERTEAGIGEGVNVEFLEDLLKTGFDPNRGLFLQNENGELYPNPAAIHLYPDTYHQHYKFLGKILGRMIFQRSLVNLPLASFFISKILRGGTSVELSELQSLDPELYRNLMYIQKHPEEAPNLNIDFTAILGGHGATETVELIPNGENIQVDENNYSEYIIRVGDFHLNKSIKVHCLAFREGFTSVIDQTWIKLFDQREFNILTQGVASEIDVDDLEAHTHYYGSTFNTPEENTRTYTATHQTIISFWNVLRKFSAAEREKFLRFVTSHSKAPLRGFKDLEPQFSIQNTHESTDRLPSSSTCVNLLKMPPYPNEQILEEKLKAAIEANTFENT